MSVREGITRLEAGDDIIIGDVPGVFHVEHATKNSEGDTVYIAGHKYDQHGDIVPGSLFQIAVVSPAAASVAKVGGS